MEGTFKQILNIFLVIFKWFKKKKKNYIELSILQRKVTFF